MYQNAGYIKETQTIAVSNTPDALTPDWAVATNGPRTYLIYTERNIHVRRSEIAAPEDATTSDMPMVAGERLLFKLYEGDQLSFVLAATETNGTVYVTPTDIG